MTYVLGVDLGTSSLKGLLMNKEGQLIAQASGDYPLIHSQHGYSEQDPSSWLTAFQQVMLDLIEQVPDLRTRLEGLAVSGQMHGLVTLDSEGEVVRPAILWNDTRTTKECDEIMDTFGVELISITKNKALEGFTLPKILWMQRHEAILWERVRHILLPKDYLVYWLTGEFATDYSDAAGTLLLDVASREWSIDIAEKCHVPISYLPRLVESTEVVGVIKEGVLSSLGIQATVQVMGGGADNACAAVGAGIVDDKVAMVSIGTSGVFLAGEAEAHDHYQGQLHLFNHGVPDCYYSMGVTLAAGHSLNWFKQTFAPSLSFEELLTGLEAIAPGSGGLLFTPYIVGERTPYADSEVRGSFTGIDTQHTLKYFARSVLEGITFSLRDSQELMMNVANKKFKRLLSVGGGSKNPTWLQIQADIFNLPVVCLTTEQGPGQGAAMMAAVGIGWFKDLFEATEAFVSYKEAIMPNPEHVAIYNEVYKNYQRVYPALKQIIR